MHPIPTPQVLDPDRMLANDRGGFGTADDDKSRADLLDKALEDTCAYAQQLWQNLDAVRQYLFDSLPSDPRSPGPRPSASASPTGPDDEKGWDNWIAAYASITSVLCGPQGDSGFGLREARGAAQDRRTAPNLTLYARHPELAHDGEAATPSPTDARTEPVSGPASRPSRDPTPTTRTAGLGAIRTAATALLVALALRGLRPRRRTP